MSVVKVAIANTTLAIDFNYFNSYNYSNSCLTKVNSEETKFDVSQFMCLVGYVWELK